MHRKKRLGHTNFKWLSVAMLEKRQQMETETYFLLFRDKILLLFPQKINNNLLPERGGKKKRKKAGTLKLWLGHRISKVVCNAEIKTQTQTQGTGVVMDFTQWLAVYSEYCFKLFSPPSALSAIPYIYIRYSQSCEQPVSRHSVQQ